MKNKAFFLIIGALLISACIPISYFWVDPSSIQQENTIAFLPEAPEGRQWNLVFYDEFNGETLDETKWKVEDNVPRRDGWWERQAVSLDGEGNLVISTEMEDDRYISGCISTQGTFENTYGYYSIRVKFNREQGHWPAFWLYGDGVGSVGNAGKDGTEIDIFEKFTRDNWVQQTLHWDGYSMENHRFSERHVNLPNAMDGFHTIGLLWGPEGYRFYMDGVETWRNSFGGVCQVPLYMIISDEIASLGGDITKADLPDSLKVDYVRVYRLSENQGLRIMSFNIREAISLDGDNEWFFRKEMACNLIRRENPDILGLQEDKVMQVEDVQKRLPDYAQIGQPRSGVFGGEETSIFYKKAAFNLLEWDAFWFSDTPDKPSHTWGTLYPRVCTWAHLEQKTTHTDFYVFNTHLDHLCEASRNQSAIILADMIADLDAPVILMGDFNAFPADWCIDYLLGGMNSPVALVDAYAVAHPLDPYPGTYHGFDGIPDGPRIDYIMVSGGVDIMDAFILRDCVDEHYPSDHFPLGVDIDL